MQRISQRTCTGILPRTVWAGLLAIWGPLTGCSPAPGDSDGGNLNGNDNQTGGGVELVAGFDVDGVFSPLVEGSQVEMYPALQTCGRFFEMVVRTTGFPDSVEGQFVDVSYTASLQATGAVVSQFSGTGVLRLEDGSTARRLTQHYLFECVNIDPSALNGKNVDFEISIVFDGVDPPVSATLETSMMLIESTGE